MRITPAHEYVKRIQRDEPGKETLGNLAAWHCATTAPWASSRAVKDLLAAVLLSAKNRLKQRQEMPCITS